jgi:hypothetical protein
LEQPFLKKNNKKEKSVDREVGERICSLLVGPYQAGPVPHIKLRGACSMDYKLNLSIEAKDLRVLTVCGMHVTIAKPVGNGSPNVAWLVFDPFEENSVEWSEEYGLYASNAEIQQGALINKTSSLLRAADGKSYLFGDEEVATFIPGTESCKKGSFMISNLLMEYSYLTFGLTQKAQVNTKNVEAPIINAARVSSQHDVTFTPMTKVYVWVQSIYKSGTVVTDITSKTTAVEFGAGRGENSLIYDGSKGCFVPAFEDSKDNIVVRQPALIY